MRIEFRAEKAVHLGAITILPVVELRVNFCSIGGGVLFSAVKQPWAVLIVSAEGERAFDMQGRELPLDEVKRKVPGFAIQP
jgi:hypothetical protein